MKSNSKGPANVIRNGERWKYNILVGHASLGTVRMEWHLAYCNIVIPMNWSSCQAIQPIPCLGIMNYHTAEAQNLLVQQCLEGKWEWLLLIEDDVVVPPDLFLRFKKWIEDGRYPVVSGLYHLKAEPAEPMVFRGRGNGAFNGWKMGDIVAVDGVPTGCLLIHRDLLQMAWDNSPDITLVRQGQNGAMNQVVCREVFRTVREAGIDPETGGYYKRIGTSDLEWCDRVINNGWLKKAGFSHVARRKYPFIIDTRISCGHIDLSTGRIF
jgi:hypothetical protein